MIRRGSERVILAAMSLAGATFGHVASYLLAHTDAHERAAVLAGSGHAYWSIVIHLAVLTLLGALIGHVAVVLGAKSRRCRAEPVRTLWFELALAQCSIFVAVEFLERVVSGAAGPWHEPAFWIALPLQLAVAAAAALLLRGTAVAAAAVARRMLGALAVDSPAVVSTTRDRCLVSKSVLTYGHIRAPPGTVTL